MMKVSDSVAASCLEGASKELVDQPSVLNKLVFVAERALPMPSASAKLCAARSEREQGATGEAEWEQGVAGCERHVQGEREARGLTLTVRA